MECKRVAFSLEDLPVLRAAAEKGRIGWGALCEVTLKATPETEARWLELAESYTLRILSRLVEATPRGELPCDPDLVPLLVPEEGWLHLRLPSYVLTLFQRAMRQLSLQARTPVSAALCQELICAEFLAGLGASSGAVEKLREEARKDEAARRRPAARQLLLDAEMGETRKASAEAELAPAEGSAVNQQVPVEEPIVIPSRVLGQVDGAEMAARRLDEADNEAPEPPFAALAGRGAICPSEPSLRLLVPDTETGWENPRLRFSEEARLATPAQRREMLRRDGYCCAVPGCPHKLWLDVHHVIFYCEGGVTLPENLIVVCTKCHRNIHKGRLKVTGSAPDGLRWTTGRGHPLERPLPLEPDDALPDGAPPPPDEPQEC